MLRMKSRMRAAASLSLPLVAAAAILLVGSLASATTVLPGSPTILPGDGMFLTAPASKNITYFAVELHSVRSSLFASSQVRIQVPPLLVAWTNLAAGEEADDGQQPTFYATWDNWSPTPTEYNFTSNTGFLSLGGMEVLGEHGLIVAVDMSDFDEPTPFSIGFALFNPIQLSACPQRPQVGYVSDGGLTQFTTSAPNGSSVTFNTSLISDDDDARTAKLGGSPTTLYASSRPNPSATSYQWTGDDGLTVAQNDPDFPSDGIFYVAVQGNAEAQFVMRVQTDCDSEREDQLPRLATE